MYFVYDAGNTKLILTGEQVAKLTAALAGAHAIETKYMGSNQPYLDLIVTPKTQDMFRLSVIDTESYEAMVLVTKLHNDKEKAK